MLQLVILRTADTDVAILAVLVAAKLKSGDCGWHLVQLRTSGW